MSTKFTIRQGDTFTTIETITDQAGSAVDLTDATVTMTIVDRNGTDLHEQEVTSHTTPASGITTITISKTATAAIPHGCYDYDLQVLLSDGTVWTFAVGQFEVQPDLT